MTIGYISINDDLIKEWAILLSKQHSLGFDTTMRLGELSAQMYSSMQKSGCPASVFDTLFRQGADYIREELDFRHNH